MIEYICLRMAETQSIDSTLSYIYIYIYIQTHLYVCLFVSVFVKSICKLVVIMIVIYYIRCMYQISLKGSVQKLKYLEYECSGIWESLLIYTWNKLYIYICVYLIDSMKRSFFQAAVASILLYGCTTWTLTKWLEKKLDGNYTRMLRAILNKSWRQHPTRHQLYGHLPPITKTIQVRRTRHAGHCWRSRDELISDVLLCTPKLGWAIAGRPVRTYIQQLCEDMGCSPEDLPEAMNDREKWRERVRDIRATSTTWWW